MSIFGKTKRKWVGNEDIQRILDGTNPIKASLDMGENRIINTAYPRNLDKDSAFGGDVVTAKALNDFRQYIETQFLKTYGDNVMDGRLDMKEHRISGLSNHVNADDAINKEYISSRLQAIAEELNDIKNVLIH